MTTASTAAAVPGQTVTFTVTVTDSGQTAYTGATVTETLNLLDDATYNNNAAATSGTVSYASPVITWTGDLAVGASAVITYTVTVNNPDTGDKSLATVAASTDPGSSCPPASSNAGCSLTVPVLTPALTIVKTASTATAAAGQTVTYTVVVTDSGQTPYTGAAFADSLSGVLGDASYNSDATATAGTVAFSSPNLTWSGDLAVGASATVTYSVTVDNPDTGSGVLTNAVTSATAGNNCPAGGTDPRCTVTVDVSALTIVNTASVSTTTPGSTVVYTLTVKNTGQTPYTGVSVTDPLTGVLDDAAFNNDASTTSGSVSYASPNLTWTGDLAPGATATITFSVTVNNPDTGDKSLTTTVTSAAAGNNCPAGGTDARCTATVTVLIPALAITKTATASTTTPGSTVGYTITVDDTGQTPYTGITVTDPLGGVLPDATYNNDAIASSGSVSYTSPTLTWTGDLTPGTTVTITYSITVNNPDTGDKTPHQHRHDHGHREQLPGRQHRPGVHRHGHRPDPGPDHDQDRHREHHHARLHRRVHDHRRRHRPDPLCRGAGDRRRWRASWATPPTTATPPPPPARRHRQLCQPGADLDREPRPRRRRPPSPTRSP